MKLKISTLFGIPIFIHWTFLILVGYGLISWWFYPINFWMGFWIIAFTISLFISVVFHELGHALMAKKFGVSTRDIILSPIGGVARLDKLPNQPIQELLVALAGPMVNVLLCVLILPLFLWIEPSDRMNVIGFLAGDSNAFLMEDMYVHLFIFGLLILNLVLAIFNLIPAFPMDGGRIIRAILTWPFGRLKATILASILGQILAVLFFVYGILDSNYMLSFIGIFIFSTAYRERKMVQLEQKLQKNKIEDIIKGKLIKRILESEASLMSARDSKNDENPVLIIDRWNNPKSFWFQQRKFSIQSGLTFDSSIQKTLEIFNNKKEKNILAVWKNGQIISSITMTEIDSWLSTKG